MNSIHYFVVVLFSALLGCSGPLQIVCEHVPVEFKEGKIQVGDVDSQAVVFALPRTVLNVTVPVARDERKKISPFHDGLMQAAKTIDEEKEGVSAKMSDSGPDWLVELRRDLEFRAASSDVTKAQVAALFEKPSFQALTIKLHRMGVTPKSSLPGDTSVAFRLGIPVIGTSTEPDPNALYSAKLKSGLFVDGSLSMEYSESGVIGSASQSTTDKTIPKVIVTFPRFGGHSGYATSVGEGHHLKISEEVKASLAEVAGACVSSIPC